MEIIPKRFNKIDIEERVRWINNPIINNYMYFDLPATVEKTEMWYRSNIGNYQRIDISFFDSNGLIQAMGGYIDINKIHNNAEFYVMVNPSMHGQGIGKKVSIWLFNYGFSVLDLNKVYLYTNDDNIAAYKIYNEAGFVLEGTLRDHKWKNGRFHNRRVYGLLRFEWNQLCWKQELKYEL